MSGRTFGAILGLLFVFGVTFGVIVLGSWTVVAVLRHWNILPTRTRATVLR